MLMQLRNGNSSYKSINVVLSDLSLVKGQNDRIFAKWGQNVAPKSHIWGPHNYHVTMISMIYGAFSYRVFTGFTNQLKTGGLDSGDIPFRMQYVVLQYRLFRHLVP